VFKIWFADADPDPDGGKFLFIFILSTIENATNANATKQQYRFFKRDVRLLPRTKFGRCTTQELRKTISPVPLSSHCLSAFSS
jgi:hypothetical protein